MHIRFKWTHLFPSVRYILLIFVKHNKILQSNFKMRNNTQRYKLKTTNGNFPIAITRNDSIKIWNIYNIIMIRRLVASVFCIRAPISLDFISNICHCVSCLSIHNHRISWFFKFFNTVNRFSDKTLYNKSNISIVLYNFEI